MNAEEVCKELIDLLERRLTEKATFTDIMKDVAAFIKDKKIRIHIVQKKGAKPYNAGTTSLNMSSVEVCSSLRSILENGELSASERLAAIVQFVKEAKSSTRKNVSKTNTTRKESNSAKTPDAPLNAFDAADPKNRSLENLNTVIGKALAAEYKETDEASPLIKMGYPGKIKPDSAVFECEAFGFALECLNADGKNSDCFIHSFLLDTCPNFRAAKVKSTAYLEYATSFRTKILPHIVDFVFAQPDFVPESPEFNAEAIKEDLGAASEFLSDDLIKAICYYYDICMVIIGPGNPRVSRVMYPKGEKAGTYPSAYVISNKQGVHWEPVRLIGTGQYLLEPDQVECIVTTYAGAEKDDENIMERERAFKGMDRIKGMTPEAIAAYIAIPDNEPGQVTELFIAGNERVRALEALKDRLVKHYKDVGGFQKSQKWKDTSDGLIEDVKDEQINELNEEKVDMAGIQARVEAFIAPPKKERPVPKKGGGFHTRRLRRRA